jgi:hypothetical protein
MRKAFIEITYDSDGASMAGASCGTLRRAEVVEVEAEDVAEAKEKAKEKFNCGYYDTIRGVNFLRWVAE